MKNLSVWAPSAKSVNLFHNSTHQPMNPADNGWWHCQVHIAHGEDYGFCIDDEGPFPDPRSRWQANGAHGLSRYCDEVFSWQDQTWSGIAAEQTIIYELHVGTFTPEGTFLAIINRLDHLQALGITHLELLPIAQFSGEHGWGYDGVGLFAPHHAYGSPRDLKTLVNACHARGLGIILDVVYNHLGPSGNYLAKFGPYFHSHYHTPWGEAVNFDGFDSPEVRQFFIDNAIMWLHEYHFDGLRLDAVQTIMDGSAIHFLEDLATAVDKLKQNENRHIILIAESHMNDGRLMTARKNGGYGLQAQWHDDFHHSVYAYLTGERAGYFQDYGQLQQLVKVLNQGVYFDGDYCHYRRRYLGRPATGLSGTNFVAYIQNHDQVGNRPGGERLSHLLNLEQLKIAAALLLTSPFIPMLFQGEEWGSSTPFYFFTDHSEPPLGKAIDKGRRQEALEFGWPLTHFISPQHQHSFEKSRLNWQEISQSEKTELLRWYSDLIQWRKHNQALWAGNFLGHDATAQESRHTICIRRGPFLLCCNCADQTQVVELPSQQWQIRLQSNSNIKLIDHRLELSPHGTALLQRSS